MQRHFRATCCQVPHWCRQYVTSKSMILVSNNHKRRFCNSTPSNGKQLIPKVNEILKASSGAQPAAAATGPVVDGSSKSPEAGESGDNLLSFLATRVKPFSTPKEQETISSSRLDTKLEPPVSSNTDADGSVPKRLENILGLINIETLTTRRAYQILLELSKLKTEEKLDSSRLENDERFKRLCNFIRRANYTQNPQALSFAIQGLQKLELPPYELLLQELCNELKWVMRRCPPKALAKVIQSLSGEAPSTSQLKYMIKLELGNETSLLNTAIQIVNRRWVEFTTGSDFIAVFGISSILPNETNEKLEDRASELVSTLNTMEMVKIIINLAQQKRRPAPLLRAMAFHISKSSDIIPAKEIIELLYALSKVSFVDQVLIHKLSHDLAPELHTITNPSIISSLVTTLGRLRFKHKELIEVIEDWVSKNLHLMRPFDYAAWLLTSAVLNLKSERQEKFYESAKLVLKKELVLNPLEWLNIVHAYCVLSTASPALLSSVLTKEFVDLVDKLQNDFIGPRMKLLNINASLLELRKTDPSLAVLTPSSLLGAKLVGKWAISATSQDAVLSKSVLSSLEQFLPSTKYLLQEVKTSSGVYIDAVCAVNSKMEPIPLQQTQPNVTTRKEVQKVAIIVAGFTSLCLGSDVPTGQLLLNERLLRDEGYQVVLIPFSEFNQKGNVVQRVQYLEAKIKNSLPLSLPSRSPLSLATSTQNQAESTSQLLKRR